MRLRVSHLTRYRYSEPVYLEPHTIRLHPRDTAGQRVLGHRLGISPTPAGVREGMDAENNRVHFVWFEDPVSELVLSSSFEIDKQPLNPFGFVLADLSLATLPITYPPDLEAVLAPYRAPQFHDRSIFDFARSVAQDTSWQTLVYLPALNQKIYGYCEHVVRDEGDPQPAAETLSLRTGACRDLAVLFVECSRAMGLAARFVSGYDFTGDTQRKIYMHAWAEVFVPGGGWCGYDPARGLAVADSHIPVASARLPDLATPISGTFRGLGAKSQMTFSIEVAEIASSAFGK